MENSSTDLTPLEVIESPFSLIFQWQGKVKTIALKDGADVLRIADIYKELLDRNDIDYIEVEEA